MPTLHRLLTPPLHSFFLFGPRGVGKTTWVLKNFPKCIFIDLLDSRQFLRLSKDPALLPALLGKKPLGNWVCIDEIQRVPQLLNEVQRLMMQTKIQFVLTGSSARKLKRADANLLAGRAVTLSMESLSLQELGKTTSIDALLAYGTLPLVVNNPTFATETLDAYVATYIKEEIREEGLIRKIDPFLRFLEIAGLMNGQKISFQNIARDAMVSASNVQNYFSILCDTLIGHFLPAYRPGLKVREVSHPKFYWFDSGVARAAAGMIHDPIDSVAQGFSLETLVFHELRVYNTTQKKHRAIFYYETGAGVEIDFLIEVLKKTHSHPAQVICIEVKNSVRWSRQWEIPSRDFRNNSKAVLKEAIGIYRGTEILEFDDFTVYPLIDFIKILYEGQLF